jgi:hypothetical protein
MIAKRVDDALVLVALVSVFAICVAFKYLPMVDVPQHYAMVSILMHHADPAWGFAQRFAFDFAGRPYATVYWLGAALAHAMPLGPAMRIVVGLCTIAPFAGAWALLAAAKRPRVWVLAALPFAFGSLWHWGFLNFLLGTGVMLFGLALAIRVAERASMRGAIALGALGVLLLLTHFHGLVMLLLVAPAVAWAFGDRAKSAVVRVGLALAPSALLAAAFVAWTWRQAEGNWVRLNPGLGERVTRFPEFLGGGAPDPWPVVWIVAFAGAIALGAIVDGAREDRPRRQTIALGAALALQVVFYFALPLNTNTATYVSARHALLVPLFALPLLPRLDPAGAHVARASAALVAVVALFVNARQLACFDREARDFDAIDAAVPQDKRIAPLVFDRASACCARAAFPYLHFAAYAMADHGGDLARTFAVVWNVPIRYRADYPRYVMRDEIEWAPSQFSAFEAKHFDYVVTRSAAPPRFASGVELREVARSGPFALFENPNALPAELPAP